MDEIELRPLIARFAVVNPRYKRHDTSLPDGVNILLVISHTRVSDVFCQIDFFAQGEYESGNLYHLKLKYQCDCLLESSE